MKTPRKTLRGIVTSSILVFALASGLISAGAMAFATEQINQDMAISGNAQSGFDEGSDANSVGGESAASETASSASSNDASAQQSDVDAGDVTEGSAEADAGANANVNAANNTAAPTASPVYTADTIGRVSASVPVGTAEPIVVGNIEYGGLTYRINPDEKTVSLVGLGSNLASGNIVVPSQVACGGKLYPVTSLKKLLGGGAILS
ncbi:hypothetical protein [Adlercreutzia sp. ZJ154]|uniref:hypothetical protein n=1 Tax=Adlercreutzia sp. ZJ154 TaxID=2709790 RepID=UPI0013ED3DD9|nr:hypothetical protein [Adlercreutzia sp. ZJ154]